MTATPTVDTSMFVMTHRAFERDARRLIDALDLTPTEPDRVTALGRAWTLFHDLLDHHHRAEDGELWPALVAAHPEAGDIVARMADQHHQLDDVLTAADRIVPAWATDPVTTPCGDARDAIRPIAELLATHLAEEESTAVPLIQQFLPLEGWGAFTGHNMQLNAGIEWTIPWLAEGQPDDVRAGIWSLVPDPVRTGPAIGWCDSYVAHLEAAFGPPAAGVHPPST